MIPERFCPKCVKITDRKDMVSCPLCGTPLMPIFDDTGALTREFLVARKVCCRGDCKNCPYPETKGTRRNTFGSVTQQVPGGVDAKVGAR